MQKTTAITATAWILLCVAAWLCTPAFAQQQEPVTMSATLNLAKHNNDTLLYNAKKNIGSILHDNLFVTNQRSYTIEQMRVTKNVFSLHIRQGENEVDEATVLAGKYLVFKRGLLPLGYLSAADLTPFIGNTNSAAALLKDMHGLQQNDFLSHIRFEITKTKPTIYQRRPKISPPPNKKHNRTTHHTPNEIKPKKTPKEIQKETLEETLYIAELALYLANPKLSVSSVQIVPIGRRANIPAVRHLQRFLNRIGYPLAKTGWGSSGKETQYFGPKTQAALETLQQEMGIPTTGELDHPTRKAIITAAIAHLQTALTHPPTAE